MSKKAILYFDGACLPVNPGGIATYGFAIVSPEDEIIAAESGIAEVNSTNNVAEYTALIKGLEKALELGIERITVKGDSQLAIRQMDGLYRVRSPRIIPLWERAQSLVEKFKRITFKWIPREENGLADELSSKAYVSFAEKKSLEKSHEIKNEEIKPINDHSGSKYQVRGYVVDLEQKTCTCPYYQKINRYPLLKRSGIVVRCKHVLAVERWVEMNGQEIVSKTATTNTLKP